MTARTRHPQPRRHAFSMLELILAMAMVAMLAVTLYMSLNVAVRAKETAAAAVEPMRSAVLAADLMRQDLESVLPPPPSDKVTGNGALSGPFIGTAGSGADTLEFCTLGSDGAMEDHPLAEGARRIELGVRTDVTPNVLVRRITRNLLAVTEPEVEEEILCRNVRRFTVRYYDGSAWVDSWDSTAMGDVLPLAVEMTLETLIPGARAASEPRVYRMTRVVPLICAKPPTDAAAGQGVLP
jgi:type II secretion system protein J